jgi:hypothetical protein
MRNLRSGRLYRVTGASSKTGQDVEITVEAYDEADAARTANRQGVFVSACMAAGPDGSTWASFVPPAATPVAAPAAAPAAAAPKLTFAEAVALDPVAQRLVRKHPQLAHRVSRLNEDDQAFLSDLVREDMGISYRDSADMGKLMKEADKWT